MHRCATARNRLRLDRFPHTAKRPVAVLAKISVYFLDRFRVSFFTPHGINGERHGTITHWCALSLTNSPLTIASCQSVSQYPSYWHIFVETKGTQTADVALLSLPPVHTQNVLRLGNRNDFGVNVTTPDIPLYSDTALVNRAGTRLS